MAVGRDGRPEAETLLWEKSAKLHAENMRHGPFRPRAVAGVVVSSEEKLYSHSRQQDFLQDAGEKPAAGSGAAFVTERRRASPGPAKVPVVPSGAARSKPRATGACNSSEHVPCAPAAPPRHPVRPAARGTRLSAAGAIVAAPKIPAAPARGSERTASPRVRAMAALAESKRAQADSATNPAVPPASTTAREAPISIAPASAGPAPAAAPAFVAPASASVATASVAAAPPSVAPAVAPAPAMIAAPSALNVQQDLPPCEGRETPVILEDPVTIKSPIKNPTKVGPPTLDDRPVATPTNSMRPCLINASASVPTRSVCVAEMWLRLARIAMLELAKLPPCASIVGEPFMRRPYNEPAKSLQARLQIECDEAQREAQGEADETERDADETRRHADETRREADETQSDADETRRDAEETHHEADAIRFGEPLPQALGESHTEATDEPCPQEWGEETPQGSCNPNPWMTMAFPEQFDGGDEHSPANTPSDVEERAIQAWTRILMRVFSVTMVGPGPPQGSEYGLDAETHERQDITLDEDAPEGTLPLELPPGACGGNHPRQGCAHVCLGELMEESVTWVDVDSDDDCHSPKEADERQAMQEEAQEEAVEMPRGMKDVYRQQNAPGIVAGMQKCLSFF